MAGAIGRLGQLVGVLLARGHTVRAITRNPGSDAAARLPRAGQQIVVGDFDDPASIERFQLRSPELAEDFERLMAGDRDIVRGSLDTVLDWRLTRATDVPPDWRTTRATVPVQVIDEADYVLIAEIAAGDERVQQLADDLNHVVVITSFEIRPRLRPRRSADFL